jgi:hypothetical protein
LAANERQRLSHVQAMDAYAKIVVGFKRQSVPTSW